MLACSVLVLAALLADFIARSYTAVHWGKDQGLVFRVMVFVVSCSILFGYARRSLVGVFLGSVIGVVVQVCALATLLLSSLILKGESNGWDIPLIWDQLIAASFLLIFGIVHRRWSVAR